MSGQCWETENGCGLSPGLDRFATLLREIQPLLAEARDQFEWGSRNSPFLGTRERMKSMVVRYEEALNKTDLLLEGNE